MKKLLMLLCMVLWLSCSADESSTDKQVAYVSFENSSSLTILYGVGYGDAEFIGTLYPNEYTDYGKTEPGLYPVCTLAPVGWSCTSYSYKTEDGKYYTVELVGNATAYNFLMWED